MHLRKGTTIIEFLVYLALFSFVMACSMHWIAKSNQFWHSYQHKRAALINECTVFDMLARDLASASGNPQNWPSFLPHQIIWHTNNGDIGWIFKDRAIYRIQGIYDARQAKWRSKKGFIVAKSIEKVSFGSTDNQTITITLTSVNQTNSLTVGLKKGLSLWKKKRVDQPSS